MTRRRSTRFTVRTSTTAVSYRSWERAAGAVQSIAAESDTGASMTDDFSGENWNVTTNGRVSPSAL